MREPAVPTEQAICCPADSASPCSANGIIAVKEATSRFQREALRGVYNNGRYRCNYFVWGSGPPLLFIPGLSDGGESFLLPIALLARDFRCIAYDLPRGGNDAARLGSYHHDHLVEDALALLDYLSVRRSYVFGSSFGSTVALRAMHRHPERLPRGILQGGFAWRPLARAEVRLCRLARYFPGTMKRLPFRAKALRRSHGGPFAACPAERWEMFLGRVGVSPIRAVAHHALILNGVDLRPSLPEIRQPILLVCGDRDPLVRSACAETLSQGLPNARRLDLLNCGHFPYFTHPEPLAEVVREFLTPPA
jgi:pimeloyl-ACP methyl ester carboxylesterase